MKQPFRSILLATLLVIPSFVTAQSLVFNHDFETLTSTLPGWCPTAGSEIFKAAGWQSPGPIIVSSPDYFHACGGLNYQVPNNAFGHEPDNAGGQAYGSIILYNTHPTIQREYLQAPLMAPLVAGVTYNVSFDVSLAELSGLAVNNIGAYLGSNIIITTMPGGTYFNTPLPQVAGTTVVSSPNGWTTITGQFVATGGEQFITLGVFGPQSATTSQVRTGFVVPDIAIYYIDNVIVQPATPDGRWLLTNYDNQLLTIDSTSGVTCGATLIGTTQDSQSGPVRRVRGLAYDGQTVWGMTRDGRLVHVDPNTGQTQFVSSMTSAPPQNWGGLAFDGSNTLYTTVWSFSVPAGPALIALDISTNPPTENFIGLTSPSPPLATSLSSLAMYPQSGPQPPPTFNGTHPALGNLYGLNYNLYLVNTSSALVSSLFSNPTANPISLASDFDPTTGRLISLGGFTFPPSATYELQEVDFTAQSFTPLCDAASLMGTIAFDDTLGVGMTFIPPTQSVQKTVMKLCVNGPSTNVPWQWWLQNSTAVVPALPLNDPATAITQAFVQSLQSLGFVAWVDNTDHTCLNVLADPNAQLAVGPVNGPQCVVTNNPNGCTVNPTITEFGLLPVPHPVGVDGPNTPALSRVRVHPNPFNPTTTIQFDLGAPGPVTVEILDLRGARIRILVDESLDVGEHRVQWRGDDMRGNAVSSGVYLVRIRAAGVSQVQKLALIR